MSDPTRDALTFPHSHRAHIIPYLPDATSNELKPFVTLTFATSLDSSLALAPRVQTALSGPQSKAMTHYLRSKHDAILIGVGTAIADDPSLNCRIEGAGGYGGIGLEGQPRPIVVDPNGRWDCSMDSKVMRLAREGRGRAPWVITAVDVGEEKRRMIERVGGQVLYKPTSSSYEPGTWLDWEGILRGLARAGIRSIMMEGGGAVINDLLSPDYFHLVDSAIVTIAPTWLGQGGVQVCPAATVDAEGKKVPVGRLKEVKWVPLGEDVVLCGRPRIE